MIKELNDKGISLDKLNKLNNEYEQIVQEMTKELNNKNISLNKYKENINKLDNEYKKEIQELKKELKESKEYIDSDKKDKDKVMKEFNKLYNEKKIYKRKTNNRTRKDFLKFKIYHPESKPPDLRSLDDQIRKLEDEFRGQKGSRTFTYQNKFVKLLTLLTQLFAKNTAHNSKKLKDDINQMLKELYK